MFKKISFKPTNYQQIAKLFRYLGWIGFWSQAILATIPIILLLFQLFFSTNKIGFNSFDSENIFSFLDILTLLFTIYWCFRYTKLAILVEKLPLNNSSQVKVIQQVWIGIIANIIVMLLAVLIGLITLGNLLYIILSIPQAAGMILPTSSEATLISHNSIITPMDILGLLAVMNVILAGLIGEIVSLFLLSSLNNIKIKSSRTQIGV